jgi:hypothetical protein
MHEPMKILESGMRLHCAAKNKGFEPLRDLYLEEQRSLLQWNMKSDGEQ